MSLILIAHVLGYTVWIGGVFAAMVVAFAARQEPAAVKAGVFRLIARLYTLVIGFGALAVIGSGVLLALSMESGGLGDLMREARLWVMVLLGLAAGLIVLFVGLPTATRVGALAVASGKGELPPAFDIYSKRLMVVSWVSGALAVAALLAWYVF